MTDMMVQDPPTDDLDDLRSLDDDSITEDDSDVTESVVDEVDDLASDDVEDEEPVAEVEDDNPVAEVEDDEPIAEVEDDNPVAEVEDDNPVAEAKLEPTPQAEPVAEAKPEPIAETKDEPASQPKLEPVTTVSVTSDDEDAYNPTLALRAFTTARDGFIWTFDRLLAGVAIVIEFIAGLDWAGYRERLVDLFGMVHERIPAQYRKVVYGVLIAVAVLIPISVGASAFLTGGDRVASAQAQTIPVSQNSVSVATVDNGILSPIFTPTVQQWAEDIAIWTNGTDISPDMFALVMQLESCGNSSVASGLFGIDGVSNTLADTDQQAQTALTQLQTAMTTTNGDFAMALAVYADGERVMTDDFALWTPHARDMYILGRNIYSQAQRGDTSSPDLNSWLQNTGTLLCTEAQSTRNN